MMPPKGGSSITDDQVKAVAAYVYSLSHKAPEKKS
jgi:mono/diheme cytochrome c family protein